MERRGWKTRWLVPLMLALACAIGLAACAAPSPPAEAPAEAQAVQVQEGQAYTGRDEVAAYIRRFGVLPPNFVTKRQARRAGWIPSEGNLQKVCPGASIGGDRFYDDDRKLPEKAGRIWHECDIGYEGGPRGPERIVWSTDGLIYWTPDHYRTFERL